MNNVHHPVNDIFHFTHTEITNPADSRIEQCFDISGDDLPPPVRLYSNDDNISYVCNSRNNLDYYFSFTCDIYGESLMWLFNNMNVKTYLNSDLYDINVRTPITNNEYQLHSTLLNVINDSLPGIPMLNSTLTVRPSRLSGLTPFVVTCQTYCRNRTFDSPICHHQHYQVLGMLLIIVLIINYV